MKRKLFKIVGGILLILILVVIVYEFMLWSAIGFNPDYSKIDRCMDNGGCWDSIDRTCRKDEADAQALCHRSKSSK